VNKPKKKKQRNSPGSRAAPFTTTVHEIPSDVSDSVEDLHDQVETWFSGLPESFQGSDKGDALQECINAMEQVKEAAQELVTAVDELPEIIRRTPVQFFQDTRRSARSRGAQLNNLSRKVCGLEEKLAELAKGGAMDPGVFTAAREACDAVTDAMGDVDFPGMY
jgi:hypothetical protein